MGNLYVKAVGYAIQNGHYVLERSMLRNYRPWTAPDKLIEDNIWVSKEDRTLRIDAGVVTSWFPFHLLWPRLQDRFRNAAAPTRLAAPLRRDDQPQFRSHSPCKTTGSKPPRQIHLPDFANLPHENELDTDFFGTTDGFRYSPRKHWCFLAEIDSIENFIRLRLIVKSGGARVPIAFYTDDRGAGFASQANRGYTVAVLYAEQHPFLDMTTGMRVEEEQTVKIIPMTLAELLALSDRVGKYSIPQGDGMNCHGCDERKASLMKCGRCSMFWYCDKTCQTHGWANKGNKNDCKVIRTYGLRAMFLLDWNHYSNFVAFPLPEPK
ncbi:hypothetical protein B0T18DRAFT_490216 [Schizothecium vesticola]|uniref:MYND-type domain-containing protein n=1 Tax=Schizothecium vesticola TaxID=314040 RepID=A0AA40EQA0_9PEZI|nr:hypothetical protein B0T18DRAFT_490216 [Schizothecium vesticola]